MELWIAIGWEVEKAGVNLSLATWPLDEFALFDRELTAEDRILLQKKPDL